MTIYGIPTEQLTAPVLVTIAILMIFTGKLVTRREHKDKIEECEHWRLAFETERTARTTSDAQTAELLEVSKTTHALIVAVFSNSEILRNKGESNVVS